jgi:predicted SAM-dependent methyltransferase
MNWKIKSTIQKTLGMLPFSDGLNYILQRYVTKGYPAPEPVFQKKIMNADRHIHAYKTFSKTAEPQDTFFEFGAGWDILIPLIYASKGVRKQIVIDISDLLKLSLVRMNIARLKAKGFSLPESEILNKQDLQKYLHIDFMAPHDGRATGFAPNSVQFISNTDTLEHIPKKDIILIVKECYRILESGQVMSCVIDLRDHYAYFDKTISFYNFLTYSVDEWTAYDNNLHYQNRLRYSDYKKIFEDCGFKVVFEQCETPTAADIDTLNKLPLAPEFSQRDLRDIGIQEIWMVLRK